MQIGPTTSKEVYERFVAESTFKGEREDFLIFPDNHPSTWIIATVDKKREWNDGFVVIAFYPHEANNHEFNDFEEFEMTSQEFMEHFGYDICEEFYRKKNIKWEAWL